MKNANEGHGKVMEIDDYSRVADPDLWICRQLDC